jgi:TPP-dependent pyruvate/acetoin dehydrogenase alpha subunit
MSLDPLATWAERFGKAGGLSNGVAGSMGLISRADGVAGFSTVLGGDLGVACGFALAARLRGAYQVVVCGIGDGVTGQGRIHEALNLAALRRLPLIVVISNNGMAGSVPIAEHSATKRLADLALPFGIPGVTVDGNDVLAVLDATTTAVSRARAGDGPTLIECLTARWGDYGFGGDSLRRAASDAQLAQEPLARLERLLLDRGLTTPGDLAAIRGAAIDEVAATIAAAQASPDPPADQAFRHVYA